jgi:hypothetical protein
MRPFVFTLLALSACAPDRASFTVAAPEALVLPLQAFAAPIAFPIAVKASTDPARAGGAGVTVGVVTDLDCGECYRVDASGERFVIHAGGVLGAQYGLADLLEAYGFGFFHPERTRVPAKLAAPDAKGFGVERRPDLTVRGLHLHTLHPTEAYFAFWEPSAENLASARRVLDWVVKNRGNFLTWPGLDNVQKDAAAAGAWSAHTRAILEEAHARGLRVGFGVQLFGQSNLQKAFDLLDGATDPASPRDAMRERLRLPLSLGFDSLQLSFGEFSGADPQRFIDRLNDLYAVAQELAPGIEVTATVHVGKDNTVTWNGQQQLYYFLVKYADPRYVPWIHTVMYYDLFEDAGGAYGHDDFSEHRDYLLSRLAQGQRAAYFPESAYWVAFDDSVPTYLPLYVRSRWLDLVKLSEAGAPLREQVLFSSGWEWGYWQTDAAVLRMGFQVPARYQDTLAQLFAGYPAAAGIVDAISALAEAQADALITHRLAPYYAGQDSVIEAGYAAGIVSQPKRPSFSDVAAMSATDRAAFRERVVAPLATLASDSEAAAALLASSGAPADDRFVAELTDGFQIDALRARFAHALWQAAATWADGGDGQPLLAQADETFAQARSVIARRAKALHDLQPNRLTRLGKNSTLYPNGYLFEAHTLCYWERERTQLRAAVLGSTASLPSCIELDL